MHAPGSRVARALTIEVTDETGRPVPGAAVSFHLPEEGPGGALANGLRTDVAMTDAQGRVSLRGLQVNRTPGRFQIRVIASKEQARAGVISSQYVAESRSAVALAGSKSRTRWVIVAAIAGAGAAAGVLSAGRGSASAAPSAPVSPPPPAPTLSIGSPATAVGRP